METQRVENRVAEAEYREQRVIMKPSRKQPWPWYAAAVVLFIADRSLKALALGGTERRLTPFADFVLFKNVGIAFSLPLNDVIFWALAMPVFGLLLYFFAISARKTNVFVSGALFFVLLGAASNLADRMLYQATIDYILILNRSAVNIADGLIVGGVIALIFKRKN